MREIKALVHILKKQLKARNFTYKDVSVHLNLSEASVKRLFSKQDLTLERLEQILILMDMRLLDLFALLESEEEYVSVLSLSQEQALIKEPKLILAFMLLLNGWQLEEITKSFVIDNLELVQLLAKLDRLKLIELLPHNKIKLLISNNFTWQKNGPVQHFFEENVLAGFLKAKFNNPDDKLLFNGGMLSSSSIEKLKSMMEEFSFKINDMIKADLKLPLEKKQGIGALLAMRPWELPVFSKLRRTP